MAQKVDLRRRRFLKTIAGAALLGLAGAYPTLIERYIIVRTETQIAVPHLPAAFAGLRIVHLTDLHYGPLMPLSIIQDVVKRANRIPHDLTVCTGDYVHERNATGQIEAVWPVLSQLSAPLGVASVLGNHDHWAGTEASLHWLKASGQNWRHRAIPVNRAGQRLWLVGAGDLWEDHRALDTLLAAVPEDECRIVLAHNPDSADTEYESRVDLMISGHTHGGQVRFPFMGAPVVPVQNKTYTSGLKRSPRGTQVFISRGIGWTVYPVRFNCYPEIAVLELVPI